MVYYIIPLHHFIPLHFFIVSKIYSAWRKISITKVSGSFQEGNQSAALAKFNG